MLRPAHTFPPQTEAPPRALLLVAFASVYLVWGSSFLAIRYAVETIPPLFMMAFRCLAAGSLLYAWAGARRTSPPQPLHWLNAAVAGGFLFLGCHGALACAEQRVPSGSAAILIATIPLWSVLLEWISPGGERPGSLVVAGLLVGTVGVAILAGLRQPLSGRGVDAPIDTMGASLILLAALSWATGSVYARHAALPQSPILTASLQLIAGGVLLVIAGIVAGELRLFAVKSLSLRSLVALVYLILFASILTFTAYLWLLRVSTPARATSFAFVNPPVALLLGWAAGDEGPSLRTGLAALAIVAAVLLIFAARHTRLGKSKEARDDRTHMAGRHSKRPGGRLSHLSQPDGRQILPGDPREPRSLRPAPAD